jgi:hypothetical protein
MVIQAAPVPIVVIVTRTFVALFGVVALVGATGCSDLVCSDPPSGGIALTVVDSQTHIVSNSNLTVIYVIDGGMPDTVRSGSGPDWETLTIRFGGRVGRYDLTVQKTGYSNWTRSGIRVGESRCNPETVAVTAPLQKAN